MTIDVHAHFVPPSVLDALARRGSAFGIDLVELEPGRSCCRFETGLQIRPFFDALLQTDQRLAEMDRQGVDREILTLWTDIFGYDLPVTKGSNWHRVLNESLAELCHVYPERFSWMASGPLQDGAAAARELDRSMQDGAVGAIVAAHVMGRNLGDCPLDEFWAACVDLNAPILIHPAQPVAPPRAERFGLNQIVAYTQDTTFTVGSLISSGVLDRFPQLSLILSHGGGSLPFLIGRFDRMYHAGNPAITEVVASQPPSSYLTRFHYDTILHHGSALRYLRDLVGLDRLLLGTDLPFPPGDPDPLHTLRAAGFTPDEIDQISKTNPRQLFTFDAPI